MAAESFFQWLTDRITEIGDRARSDAALILWCDPELMWKDLLEPSAEAAGFELWIDSEMHELEIRERIFSSNTLPRIIWLPRSKDQITYLKVIELSADYVWETSLPNALIEYGVPVAKIDELGSSVAAFALVQFKQPLSAWTNVTDRDTCDDSCILDMIAGNVEVWDELQRTGRFAIFQRRVTQEFGLPPPEGKTIDEWQKKTVAVLLCTDAAHKYPEYPFSDPSCIIGNERQWKKAEPFLHQWMKRIDLIESFENIVPLAETITPLRFWVQDVSLARDPVASYIVEFELWKKELQIIQSLESDDDLVQYLNQHFDVYSNHAAGFWGKDAHERIAWHHLVSLAQLAQQLHGEKGCAVLWRTPKDAVSWYVNRGWKTDIAGEELFRDEEGLSNEVLKVRTRLRKTYLHHLDSVNRAFSELIAQADIESLDLRFGGSKLGEINPSREVKEPVAILILDACRYDIGSRLAEKVNLGEPAERAIVEPVMAPLPTITPLGMAFSLPETPGKVSVSISAKDSSFSIQIPEIKGNLAIAEKRREYLKQYYHLQEKKARYFLTVKELLDLPPENRTIRTLGKMVFVFGDELDKYGHDDQLIITGADDHVNRYERVVRVLRNAGYLTILVTTDHGYFHWDPAEDEIIQKPEGDIQWKSRRAIVGSGLTHSTALHLQVSGSDLDCMVPRSINSFETYGGLGYFHGGATLQELIIPFITIRYPKKGKKIGAVIKPVSQITSLEPRVEIAPAGSVQKSLDGSYDENIISRTVVVKIIDKNSGVTLFKSKQSATLNPGGEPQILILSKVEGTGAGYDSKLDLIVQDADTDEILDRKEIELKVELDEWF